MRPFCILCALLVILPQSLQAEDAERAPLADNTPAKAVSTEVEYVSWVYPVSLKSNGGEEAENLAKHLSKSLGIGGFGLHVADHSIGCCFWIDIANWRPNPSDPGYMILIQPGGAQIQVTDIKQLKLAVARIEKAIVMKEGKPQVPVGLMTNYRVVAEPAASK